MLTAMIRGLFGSGCLLILVLIQLGQPAHAETERYNGVLRGDNLAPPVDTDGLGSVQLAVVGEELAWIVSFYDLESPPTAVQVYDPDGSGENANVLLDLGKNWGDLGRNNIMAGKAMLNTDQRTSLSSGKLYLLVRTQAHPDGELRAQLQRFN